MRYSLCIEMLFSEMEFTDRIKAAGAAGFSAVEFWSWWEHDLDEIRKVCRESGVGVSGICNRFISMTDPKCADDYVTALQESIRAAEILDCPYIVSQIGKAMGEDREEQRAQIISTLKKCVPYLEKSGKILLLEPVNRNEIPDYFEPYSDPAGEMIRKAESEHVGMLFDIYHQQLTEGNIIGHLYQNRDVIKHIHAAGVPERGELECSEVCYVRIIEELHKMGYEGNIGLEYIPQKPVLEGLRNLPKLG